jgi:hypothetical protein
MLNRKSLIIAAATAAALGVTALSSQAYANDDALLGAVVGGGIGAAIGHGVQGRDGALVGGAIGAIAGASIAANAAPYYGSGYYAAPVGYAPAPVYYGPAPVYYRAAPVYYPRPRIVYAPRVDYAHYNPRYFGHGRGDDYGRANGH